MKRIDTAGSGGMLAAGPTSAPPEGAVASTREGRSGETDRFSRHAADTLRLAGPISMGHLSYLAMTVATLMLYGWHSADALAAGGLAIRIAVSTNVLAGILLVVGVMMSEAEGEGSPQRVRGFYWDGLALAGLLSVVSFAWMTVSPSVLTGLGQDPKVVAETRQVLEIMRWAEPANLIRLGLMRAALPALGLAGILFVLTPISLAAYFALGFGLIDGWGLLPAVGWLGVPVAFVAVSWAGALAMLAVVHLGPKRDRVAFRRPRGAGLATITSRGTPMGVLQGADGVYYLIMTLGMGQFGAATLAAHQVVLNFGSIAYALAASCGDAGALRIAFRRGARRFADARLAGLTAIVMGTTSMAAVALWIQLDPMLFVGLFLDVTAPQNAETVAISLALVPFAALFIVADGFYGTGMGVLRGLSDDRFAMGITLVGYWAFGLPLAFALAFAAGMGGVGIWTGLVVGVFAVGFALVGRFALESRAVIRRHAGGEAAIAATGVLR